MVAEEIENVKKCPGAILLFYSIHVGYILMES